MASGGKSLRAMHIPAIHVFHTENNISCVVRKGAVECDDVWRVAVVADLQLSNNLLSDILFGINPDYLSAASD